VTAGAAVTQDVYPVVLRGKSGVKLLKKNDSPLQKSLMKRAIVPKSMELKDENERRVYSKSRLYFKAG
jgi:hypothetical protein